MIELFLWKNCATGTTVIPHEPAVCILNQYEAGFHTYFPFKELADWTVITWIIHWNDNHWVIYCANMLDHTSTILDPMSNIISPELEAFYMQLNECIENHTYTMTQLKLTFKNYDHPLQQNGYDCGVFSAHFGIIYSNNPTDPVFTIPDANTVRKEMKATVLAYNRYRKSMKKIEKPISLNNRLSNEALVNQLALDLTNDQKSVSECLQTVVQYMISKMPEKERKQFIKPIKAKEGAPEYIKTNKLVKNYNKMPKKTFEYLLRNNSKLRYSLLRRHLKTFYEGRA